MFRFFKASESENDADDRRDGDIHDGVQVFELRQLDRDRDDREQDQRFPGKQCGDAAHVKDGGPGIAGEEGDEQHGESGGGDQADRGGTKPGKDGFDDPVFGILIHDPGDGEDDEEFRQDQTEGRQDGAGNAEHVEPHVRRHVDADGTGRRLGDRHHVGDIRLCEPVRVGVGHVGDEGQCGEPAADSEKTGLEKVQAEEKECFHASSSFFCPLSPPKNRNPMSAAASTMATGEVPNRATRRNATRAIP